MTTKSDLATRAGQLTIPRRSRLLGFGACASLLAALLPAVALAGGEIVAWGYNSQGQCDVPEPNNDFVAIAAGGHHSVGLKVDESIISLGYVCPPPEQNTDFIGIAAGGGGWMLYNLGLKADSSIVAWCPAGPPPEPNTGFTAIATGGAHCLGLKADGSIVAWGSNDAGQCDVPMPNIGFSSFAAAGGPGGNYQDFGHSVGLRVDGSIATWGAVSPPPEPNTDFVAVAAGAISYHGLPPGYGGYCLGLKTDGSISAWGAFGPWLDVPEPNTGYVAIAASSGYGDFGTADGSHCLGLKEDGSIVAWGDNPFGQCDVPEPNTNFVAIAAGGGHSLAIKGDSPVPVLLSGFTAVPQNRAVLLTWFTSFEYLHDGFHVYRSRSLDSGYQRIDHRLVHDYSYLDHGVEPSTTYFYRLGAVDLSGHEVLHPPTSVTTPSRGTRTELSPAAPTPFREATNLSFTLAAAAEATVAIYDVAGRLVCTLVNKKFPGGDHAVSWNGRNDAGTRVAAGTYVARLAAGDGPGRGSWYF